MREWYRNHRDEHIARVTMESFPASDPPGLERPLTPLPKSTAVVFAPLISTPTRSPGAGT
jgi:hypothetical protein